MSGKISENVNDKDLAENLQQTYGIVIKDPAVIVGVQRKVNIGNFENIDVHMGLILPTKDFEIGISEERLVEILDNVAQVGFNIVSTNTNVRYKILSDRHKK